MVGLEPLDNCAYIAGDGDYDVEVESEIRHQDRLEWLAQGRAEEPTDYACTAVLEHEPDNPRGADAVSVSIRRVRVGYLPAGVAARMIAAADAWSFDSASCEAIIEGGWYRSAADKGDFCVRLDVNPDFVPSAVLIEDSLPVHAASAAIAAHTPLASYDPRSVGVGAVAILGTLALIGVVWLAVEPLSSARTARSSLPPPTRAASTENPRDQAIIAATSDRVPPVVKPSASQPSGLRSVVVLAKPTAVRAGDISNDPIPAADVPPVSVSSSQSVEEIHPTLDGKWSLDAGTSAAAIAVDAPVVALSPPAPPLPQAKPSTVQAVASSLPADDPASVPDDGGSGVSAPADMLIVAIPRPRPAVPAVARAARATSTAHSRPARVKSHTRSRAARHTRSRHSTHHRRRGNRATHGRAAPSPVVAESNTGQPRARPGSPSLPTPPAVRMLDGLAKEWTTRALPRSLGERER